MIKIGSDFSGVGAFNQSLNRLGIRYEEIFACDMDKYARKTFIANYGEPKYYPENVYDREVPCEPLDIYMTSPPCQAFSLAGKRKGEGDERGILFYNSYEFIKNNKPRFFIFENVKGLISDSNGTTFQRWIAYLGGKSVNGNPVVFPLEESVPYHVYWQVLNAKDYGIPQNRERVFIVGIRDDEDNNFSFPKEQHLTKRLKDILEENVDKKYYLSDKMVTYLTNNQDKRALPFIDDKKDVSNCIVSAYHKTPTDGQYLKVKSATSKGFEIAEIGEDSINLEHPNSETRRGRVGNKVAQTLTTSCNQGVAIGAIRGRNPDNPASRKSGLPTQQMLEINENGNANCLTTVQKDNVVVEKRIHGWHENENVVAAHRNDPKRSTVSEHVYHKKNGICTTIQTAHVPKLLDFRIRKLTPTECFRLMDFPDTLVENARKVGISDSQLYCQAGNSICVGVLAEIIKQLKYLIK